MALTITPQKPIAMIMFEKALYNEWNRSTEVCNLLSQYGSKELDSDMLTQRFAIAGTTGAPTRKYGDELPREFANCDSVPTFAYSEVDLTWQVAPGRISYDMLQMNNGFMGDPVKFTLDNLAKDVRFEAERNMCSGIGDDVLFNLSGAGTDNGDGTFTYPVKNYGGIAGQLLGRLMKLLLLEGTPIQCATATGVAPRNMAAVKIVSVVDTIGNESIKCDGDLADGGATADGDIVFRSREDSPDTGQGATDAPRGLPYLISDWTDWATFQDVTATEVPRFESEVIRSPGAPLVINEALLSRMLSLGEVACPVDTGDGKPPVLNGFFLMHTFNLNEFALSLLQDRRFMSPPIRNAGAAGYAKKYLTFNDLPVLGARLMQRSSIFYGIADRLFHRKNGPFWGQFMAIGGQTRFSIPCSPDQEVRWVRCVQTAAHGRAGMVRCDNVLEARPEAA